MLSSRRPASLQQIKEIKILKSAINFNFKKINTQTVLFINFHSAFRILLCQWPSAGLLCRKHHPLSQLAVASLILFLVQREPPTFILVIKGAVGATQASQDTSSFLTHPGRDCAASLLIHPSASLSIHQSPYPSTQRLCSQSPYPSTSLLIHPPVSLSIDTETGQLVSLSIHTETVQPVSLSIHQSPYPSTQRLCS